MTYFSKISDPNAYRGVMTTYHGEPEGHTNRDYRLKVGHVYEPRVRGGPA